MTSPEESAESAATSSAARARVHGAVAALRRLFAQRPAGLLTDVDGTISRITRRTDDATVSADVRRALTRLTEQLDVVGVITGRAVERAQRMVGVVGASYYGNHGLEWLQDGVVQTDPTARAARPVLEEALAEIREQVAPQNLIVEDKRVSVAVHYRVASDPRATERVLQAILAPYAETGRLRLIQGGLVVNLLPAVRIDKGEAARRLVAQHGLRAVAFFGDDVTDVDAFRALHALRAGGEVQTLAVGVGNPESPPAVRAEADIVLESVDEVEWALAALADHPTSDRAPGG